MSGTPQVLCYITMSFGFMKQHKRPLGRINEKTVLEYLSFSIKLKKKGILEEAFKLVLSPLALSVDRGRERIARPPYHQAQMCVGATFRDFAALGTNWKQFSQ